MAYEEEKELDTLKEGREWGEKKIHGEGKWNLKKILLLNCIYWSDIEKRSYYST